MPKLKIQQAGPSGFTQSSVSSTAASFGGREAAGLSSLGQGMQVAVDEYQRLGDEADILEAGNTLADLDFQMIQQFEEAKASIPQDSTEDHLGQQTALLRSNLDKVIAGSKDGAGKKVLTQGANDIFNKFRLKMYGHGIDRGYKRQESLVKTAVNAGANTVLTDPARLMAQVAQAQKTVEASSMPEERQAAYLAAIPGQFAMSAAKGQLEQSGTVDEVDEFIEDINSSKWNDVITPDQRVSLVKQAKARSRTILATEASDNADLWKGESIQAATEFTDLMISIRKGEASEEDIEKFRAEHATVNGGRDPRPQLAQYRHAMATYMGGKSSNSAAVKAANNVLDVAKGYASGRVFHPAKDKEALNDYYDSVKQQIFDPMSKQSPDEAEQYIISNMFEFAKSTRTVPTNFMVDIENMLRDDSNPDAVVAGARRYQAMKNLGPTFQVQLSKAHNSQRAEAINEVMLRSSNAKDALDKVMTLENVSEAIKTERGTTATTLLNPKFFGEDARERTSTALDELGISVDAEDLPDGASVTYQQAFKTAYMTYGDEGIAHAEAKEAVRGNWAESGFTGVNDPVLSFASPEQRYGLHGVDQQDNHKWQKEQLIQDYKDYLKSQGVTEAFHADDRFSDNLVVIPHPYATFQGKPTYIVYRDLFDEDDVYQGRSPLFGEGTYNSLPWHPNWDTSPEKVRQDAGNKKKIKDAKMRSQDDTPWLLPDIGL